MSESNHRHPSLDPLIEGYLEYLLDVARGAGHGSRRALYVAAGEPGDGAAGPRAAAVEAGAVGLPALDRGGTRSLAAAARA